MSDKTYQRRIEIAVCAQKIGVHHHEEYCEEHNKLFSYNNDYGTCPDCYREDMEQDFFPEDEEHNKENPYE